MMRIAYLCVLVASVLLGGCRDNPNYCEDHLNKDCRSEPLCDSTDDCDAPSVCNTNTRSCVECTADEAQACIGDKPTCGNDNKCRGCEAHNECTASSNVCLPSGQCANELDVAYVAPAAQGGTDNDQCTRATPCTKVSEALARRRDYVKFTGETDEGGTTTINNQNVTLLADPGAKLIRTSNGLHVAITGSSQVEIYDLEISGGSGNQGIGISLPAGNTATLTLDRVTIIGNAGGGVSISGAQFEITNSIIVKNGGVGSSFGGVDVDDIVNAGLHRLDFNTIAENTGPGSANTGINCGTVFAPLVFSNNIVYANIVTGSGRQVGGSANCVMDFSDVGPDASAGANNINVDPLFVRPTDNDFHLMPNSPAKDAADPSATLDRDIDGDARPQGDRRDMGADEVR